MTPFQPPFACEERDRPYGVSALKMPDESIVAFDPRVMETHRDFYLALFAGWYDAWQAAGLARMTERAA